MGQCLITRKGGSSNKVFYDNVSNATSTGARSSIDTGRATNNVVFCWGGGGVSGSTIGGKVQGSNNNSTWTDVCGATSTNSNASATYVETNVAYRYFRLYTYGTYGYSSTSMAMTIFAPQ